MDCMRLTTMIYERLPREIRDIIYQYVYIEDALIPIGSHHFTTYRPPMRSIAPPVDLQADRPFIKIPEGAETIDHSMGPPDMILPTDRTLDPAYIHNKVLYEAAEMYYSSNTFSICTISNAISAFLLSDHANNFSPPEDQKQARPLGLRPIDHVRNLQIRIKCEHYDRYLDKERQINLYLDTLSNLTPLAKCVTNTGIDDSQSPLKRNIEFIIMTNLHAGIRLSEQFRRFLNILETIRSTIYTLKHDCGADLHILHHDPELSTFPRTITSIFMLSKEQWEYEKSVLATDNVQYSLLHYFIHTEPPHKVTEGFPVVEMEQLLRERWGLRLSFDTSCSLPITEGEYWPRGRRNMSQGVESEDE